MLYQFYILLPLVFFCTSGTAYAAPDKNFEWELGAGLAAFDIPLYVGSAQSKQYLLPLPYLQLTSKYFEIDEGIRGFFFSSPSVRLDISADLGVPVSSDDSNARSGMPNLDTVLQVGPSVEITLSGSRKSKSEFRLELPVRTAFASDIKNTRNIGWIFEPRFTYEERRQNKRGLEYSVTAGLRYTTREYNAYYYDVQQPFVTPERGFFESGKGYSGLVTNILAGWRDEDLIYWAVVRYRNLNGAVFEGSPLVEDKDYFLIGVGVTWVFAESL